MSKANVFDWKAGEYQYCVDLVRTNGTREVPRESVLSYLEVQIASAERDEREDVIRALNMLRSRWLDWLAEVVSIEEG